MNPIRRRAGESGQALLITVILAMVLMGFGLAMTTTIQATHRRQSSSRDQLRRLYAAEAGLQEAISDLSRGGTGTVGSESTPMEFGGGGYWATTVANGNATFTVTSRGWMQGDLRVIEALVRERGHVFSHAIYAGNSSGDPTYALTLGGNGSEGDEIEGDIYSGNDIVRWGDAALEGEARAAGEITGLTGEESLAQPPFDFSSIDYPGMADIRVADEFASGGVVRRSNAAGGRADELPATNPAHIFRRNPSDRTTETSATTKDDYFLEDPYEPVRSDSRQDGSDPYYTSLVTPAGATGASVLIYIDGNLWIHNPASFSFSFRSVGSEGTKITFVVKGNVYFSDNIFLENEAKDAVAFIALTDPDVPDSGNIYFGDPRYGTLEFMQAYMYAQNNFFDQQLDASGSSSVQVVGTMAAGNQVAINRDFGTHHSKLGVTMDPRLRDGAVSLPGIPQQSQSLTYEIVAWIESSKNR